MKRGLRWVVAVGRGHLAYRHIIGPGKCRLLAEDAVTPSAELAQRNRRVAFHLDIRLLCQAHVANLQVGHL